MIGNPFLFAVLVLSFGLLLAAIIVNIVTRPKSRSDLPKAHKEKKE